MLSAPAPYPHVGCEAYLRKTGQKLRVLRDNGDRTVLCSFPSTFTQPRLGKMASGNRTVPLRDIFPTEMEALRGKRASTRSHRNAK